MRSAWRGISTTPPPNGQPDRPSAVALIGDACVAPLHRGAGVSKAADNATSLAIMLGTNEQIENAIAVFSAGRTKVGKATVARAAHLGSYFQMDETGRRCADFSPERSPVSPK